MKLLGSLLGSAEDVAARIRTAERAFGTKSWRRHTLTSRLSMFTALILPVFLYNCGLWTMPCQLGNKLDVWHRRKLCYLLGIAPVDHVVNSSIYERTNQILITTTCRTRRLLWLGHAIREGPGSASYDVLQMSLNISDDKKPRGRPIKRWINVVKAGLQRGGYKIPECLAAATDKTHWLTIIDRCVCPDSSRVGKHAN